MSPNLRMMSETKKLIIMIQEVDEVRMRMMRTKHEERLGSSAVAAPMVFRALLDPGPTGNYLQM